MTDRAPSVAVSDRRTSTGCPNRPPGVPGPLPQRPTVSGVARGLKPGLRGAGGHRGAAPKAPRGSPIIGSETGAKRSSEESEEQPDTRAEDQLKVCHGLNPLRDINGGCCLASKLPRRLPTSSADRSSAVKVRRRRLPHRGKLVHVGEMTLPEHGMTLATGPGRLRNLSCPSRPRLAHLQRKQPCRRSREAP